MLAMAAVVVMVAVALTTRLTKFLIVLQAAISVTDGMEMFIDATACLWSMVTGFACWPVLIRQVMEILGQDCFLPNLAQL
jgi:hypothetical protein